MPFPIHEQDKFRAAAADGLAMTMGIQVQSPAPGAQDFRGAGLQHIARECLVRSGVSSSKISSRVQVADMAIRLMNRQGMGTDDLSSILQDVANKSLLKAYTEAPRTFWPLVRQVSASDFKTIYGVSLSEAPELELVTEHEGYKSGDLTDSHESYSVKTYGKIIYLTRQALINDDSKALTRMPQMLGAAAARKESDIVWSLITSNPTMNEDNTALFHADHSNLETNAANKGVVDTDKLSAARAAMRKQAGPGGATLDLLPRYLIVPVSQATSAEVILRSASNPQVEMSSGVYNPWQTLTPIAEPRLDHVSTKAWYLAADTNQVDILELAYLGDADEPYIEQERQFNRDAVGFKIRHDFGAGLMNFRGLFKNPGE